RRVVQFYMDRGNITVHIGPPAFKGTGEESVFDLFLEVTEGPKFTIDEIEFSGLGRLVASELSELIGLNRGDTCSFKRLEKARSTIEGAYKKIGYIDASVDGRWVQSAEDKISIFFVVSEGAEFRYGAISIEGNSRTRYPVIRNELQFEPGDLINMDTFDRSKKAIEDLDYFESVDFHWEDSQETGVKDLFINIWEKPTGDVNFHTSFSSISGFHLVLSLDQSDFDPFNYPEFAGAGVRFAMDMDFSGSGGHLGLSFGRRDFLGRSLTLELPEASAQTETAKAEFPGAEGLEVKSTSMREGQKP
ncbi:MAG: hypothetical protein KDM64_17020, partial [Verrucomicrobiae bacterium]|nr:hypothetical protein [Verrucomicrobiae bacterium]